MTRTAAVRGGLVLGVIVVAVLVVVLVSCAQPAAQASYATTPESWVLPKLEGSGVVKLSELRGRPVVVDFFASWCTACRDELPEHDAVARRAGKLVTFVGVDSEENGDGLGAARRFGIGAWTLVRDTGGSQQSGLRDAVQSTPGMPVTAVYDAQGHLVAAHLGAMTADALALLLHDRLGITLPG